MHRNNPLPRATAYHRILSARHFCIPPLPRLPLPISLATGLLRSPTLLPRTMMLFRLQVPSLTRHLPPPPRPRLSTHHRTPTSGDYVSSLAPPAPHSRKALAPPSPPAYPPALVRFSCRSEFGFHARLYPRASHPWSRHPLPRPYATRLCCRYGWLRVSSDALIPGLEKTPASHLVSTEDARDALSIV